MLGWRVFRALLGDVVDPARARRAAWIAGAVAVVVLVVSVVTDRATGWAGSGGVRPVLTVSFVTIGAWALVFACFPTARAAGPELRINGRQVRPDQQLSARSTVQPYLSRRQRPVAPEDRAIVLNDVPLLQRGLVWRLSRLTPLLVGLACGSAAVLVSGERQPLVFLWPFFYLFLLPDLVVRIGRAERARLAALAADPAPTTTTTTEVAP